MSVRLEWDGKPDRFERLTLPFQTVETINESRATRERDTGTLFGGEDSQTTERNSLIWGDNKLVVSSLLKSYAGKVKLVYIDPPFDTGRTDFSFRVSVGDESVDKEPSVLEESAYRDTWGRGRESYLSMMYERLVLIHQLLTDDGTLYLHCAPNVSHMLKLVCDEIFGPEHFQNEISWKRASGKNDPNRYGRSHEVLLFYSKGEQFAWNVQYQPFEQDYVDENYRYTEDGTGRRYRRDNLTAAKPGGDVDYEWHGARPYKGRHWAYSRENMDKMRVSSPFGGESVRAPGASPDLMAA